VRVSRHGATFRGSRRLASCKGLLAQGQLNEIAAVFAPLSRHEQRNDALNRPPVPGPVDELSHLRSRGQGRSAGKPSLLRPRLGTVPRPRPAGPWPNGAPPQERGCARSYTRRRRRPSTWL
jgi:hypothetical protein